MTLTRYLRAQHCRGRWMTKCLVYVFLLYSASFFTALITTVIGARRPTASSHTETFQPHVNQTTSDVQIQPNTTASLLADPVVVIILTYQRSGSTFLGQIFNRNPNAFYAFEPLDGLYSAIYGTAQGYNAPSDIIQYWNGSRRIIPDFEIHSAATVLDDLLLCKHDRLPTEMITNVFWVGFMSEHLTVNKYIDCLSENKIIYNTCKAKLRICKTWLGQKGSQQELCRQQLWKDTSPNTSPQRKEFKAYKQCMDAFRKKASHCFPFLYNACTKADIKSTKVVRLSMKAIEILLKQYPNRLKVIHLLRNPKAVAVSRMKYESVRGHSAGSNKTVEATILCNVMEEDLHVRQRLEQEYPGVFFQVIYEELIREPLRITRDIYKHIRKKLPPSIEEFMLSKTSKNNTGPITGLTEFEAQKIDNMCAGMYNTLGYQWK